MYKKAFTVIELLITIALIGILSAAIFLSLRGARDKARDAKVELNIKDMTTEIEVYALDSAGPYAGYGTSESSYVSGVFTDDGAEPCATILEPYMKSISDLGADVWCLTDGDVQFRISATNFDGAEDYYCVDSSGYAGEATEAEDSECY